MSRRKQSNPKSIKVSADATESDGAEKDADVKEMLADPGEDEGSCEEKMKVDSQSRDSPSESMDSPDHIDVVNNSRSPLQPTSPPRTLAPSSQISLPDNARLFRDVVVKVEKEDSDGDHHDNDPRSNNHRNGVAVSKADNSATQGLVRHLQLPSDVLYLKELQVRVHGNPTASWMVCSAIPLPKGSSLGPFVGDMVSSDNIRVGDLIVEFHSKTGHVALVNVAGNNGAWLALLRPAVDDTSRNTLVYLEGGRIWCDIVSDVETGMELRATFVFDLDDLSVADKALSSVPLSPVAPMSDRTGASGSPPSQQLSSGSAGQQTSPGHAALIYGCPFCGVRFSSPRTLQGHLSYYCSKKKSEHIVSPRPKSRRSSDSPAGTGGHSDAVRVKQEMDVDKVQQDSADVGHPPSKPNATNSNTTTTTTTSNKRPASHLDSNGNNPSSDRNSPSPPPTKVACHDNTGPQIYACRLCSYQADKPASLNRHMRIHNRHSDVGAVDLAAAAASSSGSKSGGGGSGIPNSATYCQECNIQFSTMSTFRCHKEHYCSQRQASRHAGGAGESSKEDSVSAAARYRMIAPAALTLPTDELGATPIPLASLDPHGHHNGILFPSAHALVGEAGGSVTPGGQATVILTAPVMTPSGLTSMAIPLPTVLVQSLHNAAAASTAHMAAARTPVSPTASASPRKAASPKMQQDLSLTSAAPEEAHQSKSPKKPGMGSCSSSVDSENGSGELPLDLSKKRSDAEDGNSRELSQKKERNPTPNSYSSATPSPIADNASSKSSGDRDSSSDRHRPSSSPYQAPVTPTSLSAPRPPLLNPSLLQSYLPMPAMAAGLMGLPMPTTQGFGAVGPGAVSKCTDCNIIFYKHENFLIHKQHYCSGKSLRGPPNPALSPRSAEHQDSFKSEAAATVTSLPEANSSPPPLVSALTRKELGSGGVNGQPSSNLTPLKLPVRSPASASGQNGGGGGGVTEDVFYKFFCIPCKIKFSSASNLKAHKEYYCPHGKNSEHTVLVQTPSGEIVGSGSGGEQRSPGSSGSPGPGQFSCSQCQAAFTSSRLLKLHFCSAQASQASLLRCSFCDYMTHTEKRLTEHLKVHNPTSAFRCTLCGYRGNTVRGMRMHGKTHTDNGEDFTDSHMVEFQEPPLIPIHTNSGDHKGAPGPVDLEAELLRLKNEPYKRRRSRKAYEKVDILVPLDETHCCQLCGERFPEAKFLEMHLRIHEMADQYTRELPRCNFCHFTCKSLEDLQMHLEVAHCGGAKEEKENHPESTSPERTASNPSERRNLERRSSLEKRSPVRIKEEPIDRDYECRATDSCEPDADSPTRGDSPGDESVSDREGGRHGTERDRGERSASCSPDGGGREGDEAGRRDHFLKKPEDEVQVKKEPWLEERDEDSCNDPPLPITFATARSTPSPKPRPLPPSPSPYDSPAGRPSSSNSQGSSERAPPSPRQSRSQSRSRSPSPQRSSPVVVVKTEPLARPPPPPNLTPSSHFLPRFFVTPESSSPRLDRADVASLSHKGWNGVDAERASRPYCKACDISFTYRSTFEAHKKYYCTGGGTDMASSAKA